MTIGIAALAEDGNKLIVVSDQMITSNVANMSYQWESIDVHKIFDIPDFKGAILMAGNESNARVIINSSIEIIQSKNLKDTKNILNTIREEYCKFRINNFVQSVLEPRGIKDLQAYYELHTKIANDLRTMIDTALGQWNGQCDLIVAGKNEGGIFHLYSISNPGVFSDNDLSGYVCIGTGGPHAMYHIIGSNYRKNMNEAEVKAIVLEAKNKSEVAPGVGKLTDCRSLS